jgi:hypothetical protein
MSKEKKTTKRGRPAAYADLPLETKKSIEDTFKKIGGLKEVLGQIFVAKKMGLLTDEQFDLPIPQLIELLKKKPELYGKQGTFKIAGHLIDQTLKYDKPKKKKPSLFDTLSQGTRDNIEKIGVEVSDVTEGINLSASERKLIECICKLLHENSQNLNPKEEDYYTGNSSPQITPFGENKEQTIAPGLTFTLYELSKEYKGGEYVGGKDIENVRKILTELDAKQFLLKYKETWKKKDGGRIEKSIEGYQKIIHIVKMREAEYSPGGVEMSKREEVEITLHPIFRRQIENKFLVYPNNINKRTAIAYGSPNVSKATLRLRDYLAREIANKRYHREITLDNLYYLLAGEEMKQSRKTKVKKDTEKAIEAVKALGIIKSYEIAPGATGELIVYFTLNKGWE